MGHKIIVVGAGSAGMSCALRLKEAKQDFLVLTDNLGGRICYAESEKVNYGAYFIMKNYHHAKKLVTKDKWINPLRVLFHNSDNDYFTALSLKAMGELPEFIRFGRAIRTFYVHYEEFKRNCLIMPQKEALQQDSYLKDLFYTPASVFIAAQGCKQAADDFISKFAYACTGVAPDNITAFDFLNVCLGMVLPIHKFIFDRGGMEERLQGHLVYDTVTQVEEASGAYALTTHSGRTYITEYVVMATPAAVTQNLLGLERIREACRLYAYHIKAELKDKYKKQPLNLFPPESEIILTALQEDGSYLIYTREKEADLHRVCHSYELINMVSWEKAMYVYGDAYIEQHYQDKVYIAGDHNGLGLEPAAISGIYAANQIIKRG